MSQKVQQLINDGVITIKDILEYANDYQIDKYYQEEYSDIEQYNMEYEQAEHDRMMKSEDMYGSDYDDMPLYIRSDNPEYVIASTSYRAEETYVFEATSDGKIFDSGEYGGLAKRWGVSDWQNHELAVREAMDNPYRFEREIQTGSDKVRHFLYSKINPADYWDGE